MQSKSLLSRPLGLGLVGVVTFPLLFGCAVSAEGVSDEVVGAREEALVGQDEFLYFRCNATGWDVNDASRLEATSDPYTFRLTYRVSESWMVSSGDSCQLTLTNQKNGWGTQQSQYGLRAGFSPLVVPNSAPLALNGGSIAVRYPTTGFYTAQVNFRSGTIAVAAAVPAEAAEENASRFYSYLQNRFGWAGIDGAGTRALIGIGMGLPNNAQWNQSMLMIGIADGIRTDSFAFSRDMIAHELTHAVITNTSEMRPDGEAGVINESFADVFAAFSTASGATVDWTVGETVWTPGIAGDALRRLNDPHSGYNRETLAACQFDPNKPFLCGQSAHLREYINAGVDNEHLNLGILNRAAYLLVQGGTNEGIVVPGIGVQKAEQIYWKTMTQYLTRRSTFRDVRFYLGQTCQELVGQFGITAMDCQSIGKAFSSVGIDAPVLNAPSGISGKVIKAGVAAPGTPVILAVSSVNSPAIGNLELLTTTTDASGVYRFSSESIAAALAPPLPQVEVIYQVRYRNSNASDLTRVASWDSQWFERVAYASGTSVPTFEIAGVVNPTVSGVPSALPMTFSWNHRTAAREYYRWEGTSATNHGYGEYYSHVHVLPSLTVTATSYAATSGLDPFAELARWSVRVSNYEGAGVTNSVALP